MLHIHAAKRIKIVPYSRIELKRKLVRAMTLSASVELGKYTDNALARNVFLFISIISSNDVNVVANAYDAVHRVSVTARAGVDHDVVFFQLSRHGLNDRHISMSLKERAHTRAASDRGIDTVTCQL